MEIEKETLDQLYVTTMQVERESYLKLVGKYNLVKQKAFPELLFSRTRVYYPPFRPSAPLLFFRAASSTMFDQLEKSLEMYNGPALIFTSNSHLSTGPSR